MPRSALTGTRIRERRSVVGRQQADLARAVGISPAYLNLIEHNRRRIGGKLLMEIARELGTEVSALTEGAEAALIDGLREAASAGEGPELDRIEEFAGRFPGWAGLVEAQRRRIKSLEETVETLADRLTHDPFLSEALHEVLSTVTAIRSTAGILAAGDVDPGWQARFLRNLHEDSQRLAEGSQSLVTYLDTAGQDREMRSAPQDEVDAWLSRYGFHLSELEQPGGDPDILVADAAELQSRAARELARAHARRYAQDAQALPMADLIAALDETEGEPGQVAARFGVDLPCAMRRLASLPPGAGLPDYGLVSCDASGTLTLRKPVHGFVPPRFGAACALWPLYQALLQPLWPRRQLVEQVGPLAQRFRTWAVCVPHGPPAFDQPQVVQATMLFRQAETASTAPATPVGTSCRICPREGCRARREPSIVAGGV